MIEVFIHSLPMQLSEEAHRFAELYSCERAERRMLCEEDAKILREALKASERIAENLKVYDVSRIDDKIQATKLRIRKTPTILVNGEKYEGFKESRQALHYGRVI